MLELPADFLHLICEELANREDFGTLFSCALTGKALVGPALLWLYRIHNKSPVINSEGTENDLVRNDTVQSRVNALNKTSEYWALQWKSIIRSSLGHTSFPYCLWIRSLDLRNLADLLQDNVFLLHIQDDFFSGDMSGFLKVPETPMKKRVRGAKGAARKRLDVQGILDTVGESITSFVSGSASQNHTTVLLEDLAGDIRSEALPRWVGRLSKLKSLTLWDGSVLNSRVAEAITNNCYNFDDLTFYGCLTDADSDLAAFFLTLRSQTLRSFLAISAGSVGPLTLSALNHHGRSLKRLELDGLKSAAIKSLSHLQDCDQLESLDLWDAEGLINLEATENDIYLGVVSWLVKCNNLRKLTMTRFVSGPAILTEVCLSNNVRLASLKVIEYPMIGNNKFHKALSHQTSLESLELKADPEGVFGDDYEDLITSISTLTKLKQLNLLTTSDYFGNQQILRLVSELEHLEDLRFSGYSITDDIWRGIAGLKHLRVLIIDALTNFTCNGILAYISTLQETNRGMTLSVTAQSPEYDLPEAEQATIRGAIAAQVDGKFEYSLFREVESDAEIFSD